MAQRQFIDLDKSNFLKQQGTAVFCGHVSLKDIISAFVGDYFRPQINTYLGL